MHNDSGIDESSNEVPRGVVYGTWIRVLLGFEKSRILLKARESVIKFEEQSMNQKVVKNHQEGEGKDHKRED